MQKDTIMPFPGRRAVFPGETILFPFTYPSPENIVWLVGKVLHVKPGTGRRADFEILFRANSREEAVLYAESLGMNPSEFPFEVNIDRLREDGIAVPLYHF